jgi:hypothetical protein
VRRSASWNGSASASYASTGDGKQGEPPSGQELKQTFITRADQVCAEFRREASQQKPPRTAAGLEQQARRTRILAARTVDQLRALNPPGRDRRILDRYLQSLEQSVRTLLPALERAARAQDRAEARRLAAKLLRQSEMQQRLAQQYGFRICGARR